MPNENGISLEDACTDILYKSKKLGLVEELGKYASWGLMDEVHSTLVKIQEMAESEHATSIRLMDDEGKLIDQVGDIVSLQNAGIPVEHGDNRFKLVCLVSGKPDKKRSYNVIWHGLELSGKSSLLHRVKHGEFRDFSSTIGLNVETFTLEGNEFVNYDIPGDIKLREKCLQLLIGTHKPDIFVHVLESSKTSSYNDSINSLKREFLKNPYFEGVPVIIIVNKQDIDISISQENLSRQFKLDELLKGRKFKLILASAKNGLGIDEILYYFAELLLK